jgi:hypothetical protein
MDKAKIKDKKIKKIDDIINNLIFHKYKEFLIKEGNKRRVFLKAIIFF